MVLIYQMMCLCVFAPVTCEVKVFMHVIERLRVCVCARLCVYLYVQVIGSSYVFHLSRY